MRFIPSHQQAPKDSDLRSGIIFGPGRSTRLPEKGSPEYQEIINRIYGTLNNKQ